MKHKLLYEILAALIIIGVGIFRFDFILGYVNGSHELNWAYEGYTETNMNLRFLFLFGTAGYGIYWMVWNFATRRKMIAMISSVLIAAIAMAYSFVFYYSIPMIVVIAIVIIKIKTKRTENDKDTSDRFERIHRVDSV